MFVLDSHCDTPSQILRLRNIALDNDHSHVDFPKLKKGGVDGSFFALYIPASLGTADAEVYAWRLLDALKSTVNANSDCARFAYNSNDAFRNQAEGLFSVFVGLENGSPIDSTSKLAEFYNAGIRYVTLCHSRDNGICDSCASESKTWNGLSPFGKELISEMNKIGMVIDVSHISDESFYDVLEYTSKPVVASHSCCRALAEHPRNMTDEMLRKLSDNGGVIQINMYPIFLDSGFQEILDSSGILEYAESIEAEFIADPSDISKREKWYSVLDRLNGLVRPSYRKVVDHIEHAIEVAGVDHVGIGTDFDGITVTPEGLEDVSKLRIIFDEMKARGYSEEEIGKVAGGNFLRVLDGVKVYK